jgi:bla regulator protein BlaR1
MAITGFSILSNNLLSALSETLLNSIWQGLALAAIATLILISTRRSTPAFRYNLLLGALVAFTCVSATTFVHALGMNAGTTEPFAIGNELTNMRGSVAGAVVRPVSASYLNWRDGIFTFMQLHNRQVVALWLVVVLVRCLQLVTGIQGLYDLRRRQVFQVSAHWENRIKQICENMGINRAVRLAESGLAKAPVMIGHLKPVILLPIGLLTALGPSEVEAILIHELAHIRRRDYLVNVLQYLLETFFFFNPAVLWVSAQIRRERENCCDDIVLEQTGNQIAYIKALVACQEYQAQPQFAMAIQGQKGSLLGRVNRMISGKNPSLNLMERYVLGACLLISCVFLLGFSNPQTVHSVTQKAVEFVQSRPEATPAMPKASELITTNPKELRKVNVQSPLPADTSRHSKKQKKTAVVTTTTHARVQTSTNVNTNTSSNDMSTSASPVPPATPAIPAVTSRAAVKSPIAPKAKQDNVSDKVLADMVKDGLVSGAAKQVSFKLTNTSFEVNGKQQPEQVFERYRRKYVPETKPGSQWSIYRNFNQNSSTTTTTVQTP